MFLLLLATTGLAACAERAPIVLVNGIQSAVLSAAADMPETTPNPFGCPLRLADQILYISLSALSPENVNCSLWYMTPHFNATTRRMQDMDGVRAHVTYFGETKGVYCLCPYPALACRQTAYFKPLIDNLQKQGYKDGVDLFAAPYDWRYTGKGEYVTQLATLLRDIKSKTGKRAFIVSHSMGGPVTYDALHLIDGVEDLVAGWVSVAGAFLGSGQVIDKMVNGLDMEPVVPRNRGILLARRVESLFFLLPRYDLDRPVVTIGDTRYTQQNVSLFLKQLPGMEQYAEVLAQTVVPTLEQHNNASPVPMYCVYSDGYETREEYHAETIDGPYTATSGNGDGQVNIGALEFCTRKNAATEVKYLGKGEHSQILATAELLKYIMSKTCSSETS